MVVSQTPKNPDRSGNLGVKAGPESACIAVAFSGGRDSTALLHAAAVAAHALANVEVVALHVHHGLSAHADEWLRHAQSVCADWAAQGLPVRLVFRRVNLGLKRGVSVEAVARAARKAALHEMALELGVDLLLLAHHRQDQAETLLLQALRGGGAAGLAGMPRDIERDGVRWVRPWLDHPRSAIEAYIEAHGLSFIEDDSNTDLRYARNRLRLSVWPALLSAFPEAEVCLAASARRLSDSISVSDDWFDQTQQSWCGTENATLDAHAWSMQDASLRRESLRHWYRRMTGQSLPASWVERLSDEIPMMLLRCSAGRWPEVGLSFYRGVLEWSDSPSPLLQATLAPPDVTAFSITGPGDWPVPAWQGVFRVQEVASGGVAVTKLTQLTLRTRQGGEQFQANAGRPPRTLKKQFQAFGVPPWARVGPLAWFANELVYVPGLGLDARAQAPDGAPQCTLSWHPDVAPQ